MFLEKRCLEIEVKNQFFTFQKKAFFSKLPPRHHASLQQRVDYLEKIMGDSADKHTAHLKKLEELGHTGGWLYGVFFFFFFLGGGMIFFLYM